MNEPRLLDLFCGAGGAARGYTNVGYIVTGVDNRKMPNFPYEFHQADALGYLATHWQEYDALHLSPPCQDFTVASHLDHGTGWLLKAVLSFLHSGEVTIPWVVENVPQAPLRADYKLCGCMFGLPGLRRERWFETSWGNHGQRAMAHDHSGDTVSVFGNNGIRADREAAMDIDWMSRSELSQAIPPAYTEYLGRIMRLFIKEK